jgi:hypothetical protein
MRKWLSILLVCVMAAPASAAWDPISFYKGAFKKTAGVAHTANANDPPNEGVPSQIIVAANQIMGQTIPGTPPACDPQDAVDLGIAEYVEADLTLVSGSDNKCYELEFPTGYGAGGGYFGAVDGELIRDYTFAIPLSYNQTYAASDHSGGYGPDLYDNSVRVPSTSASNWWFDPYSATITSESNLSLGATGTVMVYLWTGATIADNLPLHNFAGTVDPTADDDADDGYDYGSVWIDTVDDEVFMCVLPTAASAVWVSLVASCSCPTADEIADAVLDELLSLHTDAGSLGKALADVLADTDELQSDDVPTLIGALNDFDPANDDVDTVTTLTNKTGFALSSTGLDAIEPEVGFTLPDMIAINAAVLAGKLSGAGTSTIIFKAADGSATRVTASVDGSGNRTSITIAKP